MLLPAYDADNDSKTSDSSVEQYYRRGSSVPLDMLNAHLIRSRNMNLRVIVKHMDLPSDVLDALLGASSRWESLNCPYSGNLIHKISGKVPLLRKIHIGGRGRHRDSDVPVLDAPALHDVSLRSFPSPLILPWSQITRYHASGRWNDHLEALSLMVNLLECHLRVYNREIAPRRSKIVSVPTLRKLHLHNAPIPPGIPDNLLVPALEDLFVYNGPNNLASWLRGSQSRLRRLAIDGNTFSTAIMQLFQQSPTITDITVSAYSVKKTIRILNNSADISILPNLKRLAIYFSGGGHGFDELINLIHSRRPGTSHALESVSLGGPPGFFLDSDLKSTMKQFEEDGLHVLEDTMHLEAEWYVSHGWEAR
ncbi:hypothetical protein B0H13DRAFT_2339197 [Mycena leptocephala]|nr:hypothetical protein B0H13DRAFT_2339197 [Mycena leptocephala]